MTRATTPDVDVLVIGAGLSGIDMAAHLAMHCPERTFTILERRQAIGGTWDVFRYPGIRCDSDMYTLGYSFRPWLKDDVIVRGEDVLAYIQATADEFGITPHIRFGERVSDAAWSTQTAMWTITSVDEATGHERVTTARFVVGCAGFYSHDEAHAPDLPGLSRFQGDVVHPQFWDPSYDWSGKRVLLVGSGATAVTMAPAMAQDASQVFVLQRSPSYILSVPEVDPTSRALKRVLPDDVVATLTRYRNTALQLGLYRASKRWPGLVRAAILARVRAAVGPDVDMRHFTPRYDPWDERLCVVPDGDLFRAVRSGAVTMITDTIDTFTETGVQLTSGDHVETDLVVTATGLQLQLLGNVEATVDGEPVDPATSLTYKGVMVSDVPNFAMVFGYVNVSWTRKADLAAAFVCRVLNHMAATGHQQVTPRGGDGMATDEPFVPLRSGYIERSRHLMPRQGRRAPWRNHNNVFVDTLVLRHLPVQDRHLRFTNGASHPTARRRLPGLAASVARVVGQR
ncbi:MAG TPA: NAD(P)/FAD-dependent oxidoreductase [Nitriliruptorales bacterium]